jgi:tRNA threonylcarbamoyl adenosine modification protein YeaZ
MAKFVLAFELSGKVCTAALGSETTLQQHDFSASRGRGLMQAADLLLRNAQATREQIGAVLVGVGPGSYTGLRIACSAAAALAMALDIPALGINSFEAAVFAQRCDGPLHLLLDAYRNEVYHACFERQENTLHIIQEARVISREAAISCVNQGQSFLGDSRFAGPGATLIGNSETTAAALLELAFERGLTTNGSGMTKALAATPMYLRPAAFRA